MKYFVQFSESQMLYETRTRNFGQIREFNNFPMQAILVTDETANTDLKAHTDI